MSEKVIELFREHYHKLQGDEPFAFLTLKTGITYPDYVVESKLKPLSEWLDDLPDGYVRERAQFLLRLAAYWGLRVCCRPYLPEIERVIRVITMFEPDGSEYAELN